MYFLEMLRKSKTGCVAKGVSGLSAEAVVQRERCRDDGDIRERKEEAGSHGRPLTSDENVFGGIVGLGRYVDAVSWLA
jgi:hypothetical protein